jgi:hypothetical protein
VRGLVVLLVGVSLLAAGLARAGATPSTFRVRLERTACFGSCPIYAVTVHGDGRVVFVGKRFVRATGVRRATISRASVAKLYAAVRKARVFELDGRYDSSNVSDLPAARLAVRLRLQTKRIYHYLGDASAPARLKALECLIDRTAKTVRWIGRSTLPC